MRDIQIVLEVVEGSLRGNQYRFENPIRILVGRAIGCDIQLPDPIENQEDSRYYCILDVDPPSIHVRDLGSRSGTYLNGLPIGPPSLASQAEALLADASNDGEMTDGDELRVGDMLLCAHVVSRDPTPEAAMAPIYFG